MTTTLDLDVGEHDDIEVATGEAAEMTVDITAKDSIEVTVEEA